MHVPFVDLFAQYQSIKNEIDQAIADAIRKTSFIGGDFVKRFEAEWAKVAGLRYCVSTANGTDSLEILLKAYGVGAGHEVIVPSHSWISTAEAVVTVGAVPVFVDTIDKLYTIDASKIEEKITEKTRAIIPVHLCGLSADMDPILAVAKKHKLVVIEDCAQSHLAEYKGRLTGTMGDAASYSFYPGKNLGAYGDAGAIATNNEQVADFCRRMANHGQIQKHHHTLAGRNSRLDSMQAAILLAKLPHLKTWTDLRIQKAKAYQSLLNPQLNFTRVPENYRHVYHLFMVQVNDREKVMAKLKEKGIETAVHYPVPMPLMPAFKDLHASAGQYATNQKYADRLLSLPIFPEITQGQIQYVASAVNECYAEQ